MSKNILQNCPVCGSEASFLDEFERNEKGQVLVLWSVACSDCGLSTGSNPVQLVVAAAWNSLCKRDND